MQLPLPIVRRNDAARNCNRRSRFSSGKEQQHLLTGNIERTKTIVALDSFESEDAFIKDHRAVQLIDIERRLEHASDSGHISHPMVQSESWREKSRRRSGFNQAGA